MKSESLEESVNVAIFSNLASISFPNNLDIKDSIKILELFAQYGGYEIDFEVNAKGSTFSLTKTGGYPTQIHGAINKICSNGKLVCAYFEFQSFKSLIFTRRVYDDEDLHLLSFNDLGNWTEIQDWIRSFPKFLNSKSLEHFPSRYANS